MSYSRIMLGVVAAAMLAMAAPDAVAQGAGAQSAGAQGTGAQSAGTQGAGTPERMHGRAHFDGEHHGGGEMGFFHPRLIKELNLSPDQQKKFKEYRLAFEKKKIQLRSEKAMLELDLKNVLSSFPVNQAQAMKIGDKIGDLEKKALLLKVEAWSQFLANLTAEQHQRVVEFQAEFKEKRREWREQMRDKSGEPGEYR